VQGDLIVVQARAINGVGPGEFSDSNTFGVTMQQAPLTPTLAPIMVSQAETTVTVELPEITGINAGGSPIISYHLVYSAS